MPNVRIQGLEETIEVKPGATLLDACKQQRINLFWGPWARALNCRGIGLCSACKVSVVEGAESLPARTKHEAKRLAKKPDSWRLGCQIKVTQDLVIEPFPTIPPADRVSEEALRRATLSEEEREQEEHERQVARRAAHAEDKQAQKAAKAGRPPGRIARLLKRGPKEDAAAAADKPGKKATGAAKAEASADADAAPKKPSRFAGLRRGKGKDKADD